MIKIVVELLLVAGITVIAMNAMFLIGQSVNNRQVKTTKPKTATQETKNQNETAEKIAVESNNSSKVETERIEEPIIIFDSYNNGTQSQTTKDTAAQTQPDNVIEIDQGDIAENEPETIGETLPTDESIIIIDDGTNYYEDTNNDEEEEIIELFTDTGTFFFE